jgi:hypothetical protein
MKYRHLILLTFILAAFASCERLVDNVEVPRIPPQLVMYSFLSPEDSVITVQVSISTPLFENVTNRFGNINYVTNAQVNIQSNTGRSATFPAFDDEAYGYILSTSVYAIIPGETYRITVQHQGKTAWGETTIPATAVPIQEISHVQLLQNNSVIGSNTPAFKIRTMWNDPANENNFYRVVVNSYFGWQIEPGGPKEEYTFDICNTNMYDDQRRNGQQIVSVCDDYNFKGPGDTANYKVLLLTTDKPYYEYHIRRLNYVGEDPFSEPTPMYHNVNGGLGVVGSYRVSTRNYELIVQ